MSEKLNISQQKIQSLIFTIRGEQVMLDRDLAAMYQVQVKRLNEQVKKEYQSFPGKLPFSAK